MLKSSCLSTAQDGIFMLITHFLLQCYALSALLELLVLLSTTCHCTEDEKMKLWRMNIRLVALSTSLFAFLQELPRLQPPSWHTSCEDYWQNLHLASDQVTKDLSSPPALRFFCCNKRLQIKTMQREMLQKN